MATPNPNFGDLAATTINYYSSKLTDDVTAQNALFSALNESGNVQPYDGGTQIIESLSYAENGNVQSYSGADALLINQQQEFTAAEFNPAQYAVSVVWTGEEKRANTGDAQIHNLLKSRITNAGNSMKNRLNRDLYLDGTGNNGKNLTGLAAAVPLSNATGVYGGIDRATHDFWRNKKFQASVDGGAVATAATILGMIDRLMLDCTRQNDKPNLIITDIATYSLINAALQTNQRFTSSKSADAGFEEISYKGVRIRWDSAAAGMGTGVLYMLNTTYLHLCPHKTSQFVDLPEKTSINQDATVRTMIWVGNLTCSSQQRQGIFRNI